MDFSKKQKMTVGTTKNIPPIDKSTVTDLTVSSELADKVSSAKFDDKRISTKAIGLHAESTISKDTVVKKGPLNDSESSA